MKQFFPLLVLVTSVIVGIILMIAGIIYYAPCMPLGACLLASGPIFAAVIDGHK